MKRRSTKLRYPGPPPDGPYLDFGDGRFQLVVAQWPQHVMNVFDERKLHGGGPTSQGLLLVFAQLAEPPITSEFHVGSESSEAWVTSDKDTLDRFAKLVERAKTDAEFLSDALDLAEEQGIE